MMRFFTLIIGVAGIGFIIYTIATYLNSISGTRGQRTRDEGDVRHDIEPLLGGLVPLNSNEMPLLSINVTKDSKKAGLGTQYFGHVLSIYHEPLLAYGRRQYGINGNKSLTIIKSTTDEYVYHSEGSRTEVYHNGHNVGVVNSDGNLYDHNTRELVAHIDVDEVLRTHPVKVYDREVGELINVERADAPSPRAYEFIENMSSEEMEKFQALTFLMLVEQIV